ncbi:MAG: RcnB family protein [Caulobacteraceae bacterium]|nr:RcnB family protein [Caulobacteraceae bacterium]
MRIGFYFAPGYGYYNVPRSYWGRHYYEGSYLPSFFFRYRVIDPYFYGLPPAPPGTAWVYVDNSILLVDLYDGYVIEVISNAWYW